MARRTWDQYEKYLIQRWPLTRREVGIALECIKGKKNKEIACHLGISAETVNKHLDRIYSTTGINGRDQLVAELLVADIDNTPLQQSLRLTGVGAAVVGAGFLDALYASRSERKRPRSASVRSLISKGAENRSRAVSSAAAKDLAFSEQAAAVAGVGSRSVRRRVEAEYLTDQMEDDSYLVLSESQIETSEELQLVANG
ncbi:MAG: helix-turn-helix transcriptional regulator [Acidobacteriota bacterium]